LAKCHAKEATGKASHFCDNGSFQINGKLLALSSFVGTAVDYIS